MAALVKQGCHHQYDVEGSLQRIVFKMLGAVGERGLPHRSLFDFDESRPYNLRLGNPLQVMFKKYLANEIRSISLGCIPSIRTIQRPGRLSIGQGREDAGMISPDDIPNRAESDEPEMMNDLIELLRKQSTSALNLVDLFHSMLNKEGSEVAAKAVRRDPSGRWTAHDQCRPSSATPRRPRTGTCCGSWIDSENASRAGSHRHKAPRENRPPLCRHERPDLDRIISESRQSILKTRSAARRVGHLPSRNRRRVSFRRVFEPISGTRDHHTRVAESHKQATKNRQPVGRGSVGRELLSDPFAIRRRHRHPGEGQAVAGYSHACEIGSIPS